MKTENTTTELIEQTDRQTKLDYLNRIGLFREDVLNEMEDEQLNELVKIGVEIKGY
ncbi:MAG: hypothetical protein KKF56_05685 [Nanoarchaeota archaeon]|nr:hypothetical protein [Nanoarchaeota archaeon]